MEQLVTSRPDAHSMVVRVFGSSGRCQVYAGTSLSLKPPALQSQFHPGQGEVVRPGRKQKQTAVRAVTQLSFSRTLTGLGPSHSETGDPVVG